MVWMPLPPLTRAAGGEAGAPDNTEEEEVFTPRSTQALVTALLQPPDLNITVGTVT